MQNEHKPTYEQKRYQMGAQAVPALQNEPQLPKDVESRFNQLFVIERVTKMGVEEEGTHYYIAKPTDLKGSDAAEAMKAFLAQELERQRQEYIEAVEKLKYGQNVIINAVSRSEKAELAEPLLSHNKTLDDVLAILKKARE